VADWQDIYRPGSYRGIGCLITDVTGAFGLRTVTHEVYSGKRHPVEFQGPRPRTLQVSLMVIGSDHHERADELQRALEEDRGGELVHPWRGRLAVVLDGEPSRRDSIDHGGATYFQVPFREWRERPEPDEVDPKAGVKKAADQVRAATQADLEANLATTGFPEYVRDATVGALKIVHSVLAPLQFIQAQADLVAAFSAQVQGIIVAAQNLALAPANLGFEVLGAIDAIGNAGMAARDAFWVYHELFGLAHDELGGDSYAARAADANARLVVGSARLAALYGAARAAADARWRDQDEIATALAELEEEIEALQLTASDDVHAALADMRVAIVNALPAVLERSGQLRSVTLSSSLPALVLAYRFHDDVTRADEIVERNRPRHPLFVGGGRPLLVAIDPASAIGEG